MTVGEFISATEKFSEVRVQTLRAYVQAFRKIVAEVEAIPTTGKHTKVGEWLEVSGGPRSMKCWFQNYAAKGAGVEAEAAACA